MALVLKNVKLPLAADESSLKHLAARALAVPESAIRSLRVVRVSTDARKKNDIVQLYSLRLELDKADEKRILARAGNDVEEIQEQAQLTFRQGERPLAAPVIVVGMGPAGLFAAYVLAKYGYRPIVIDRGRDVQSRTADVDAFCATGKLDTESNVMFGEGGAGAFSDGKLVTRIKDPLAQSVLETLAAFGAPQEICIQAKPHVGTDKLKKTVQSIRQEIVRLGGEVRFETKLTGIESCDGVLRAVRVSKNGMETRLSCAACVLAHGQGARDTYRLLAASGLELVPKAFAVGVRIEHPRTLIDEAQFGRFAGNPRLGAAEYHLSEQIGGRGVYTFCMCPGGVVIASASEAGQVVTNGMSYYARDGENSNAAIVVQVTPADYGDDPLDGLRFQDVIERAAYQAGGGGYIAPACCAGDLLAGRVTKSFGSVRPTYKPGVCAADIGACLPDYITNGVRAGIQAFGRRIKGYDMQDAVITAVESRTSAPLRILRDENREATRCKGLYPVGEGAGYAGGIVSAAVDGLRAAQAIMALYKPDAL
ncbi:MAG: FAD-dependent monooxygenase [Clostridia bacterium]|nr:FAD-dependent monooxygenase [Clostridia bacterium]